MKRVAKRSWIVSMIFLSTLSACKKEQNEVINSSSPRTYLMGFQNSAPRIDFDLTIQSLHIWEQRADAAIITTEVPWDSLLSGQSATNYVNANYKGLVEYYRTKNFKLWVYIDPANGLDRTADAVALVARKKSIAQSEIQDIYRKFVFAMDSILQPEHLGLALETNTIRGLSPDSIYQGVKKATNNTAKDILAFDKKVKLSISVQVDYAWGKMDNTSYKSVDVDFVDFSFIAELGLSSYPYFAFEKPADIPINYYSRLIMNKSIPVFVSEGGWTSASVNSIVGSPQKQTEYILREAQLLDEVGATAFLQLAFTDLDLSKWPANIPANLYLFASMGLVDINLNPKPALSAWDSVFSRHYLSK